MYKSCFLGCGPRARGHASAYQYVKNGRIAALCDLNEERLHAFGQDFGVESRYTDIHEMLDKESPDLLHIVTPPNLRVELMTIAAEHEVPVAIVEKPIAIQGEDWRQIRDLNAQCKTNFVLNTQLHFHARNLELNRDVAEGRIGEVRFIDASARSTISDQGVHVLELAQSYNDFVAPVKVFGSVAGTENISTSPAMAEASIVFENGVRAQLLCGEVAPTINENKARHMHKRISAYGTRGFVQWTMVSWERNTPEGGYESGTHDYGEQDVLAQAGLTDAAFDWAEDEANLHPTRLERALIKFNIILGVYESTLQRAPISLPFEPPDGLIDSLRSLSS